MRMSLEFMQQIKTKIKGEVSDINKEIRSKVAGYIMAAFGLVAGLAWNDAIKSFIEHVFPMEENSLWAKFIYAIIITLILVIVSVYIVKILRAEKTIKKKK